MFDRTQYDSLIADGDPRITEDALRRVPGDDGLGTVVMVSVAHDHPASVARVSQVLDTLTPDILALELPPLALPLFRSYASEQSTPPSLGGEMSMALQTATEVRTVGIDVPTLSYLRVIGRHSVSGDLPRDLMPAVAADLIRATAQALACRVLGVVGRLSRSRPRCYTRLDYDCTAEDTPERQAAHEQAHISKQQAFLRAVEIPEATTVIDCLREESMVSRLHALRRDGDLVVVLGAEHAADVDDGLRRLEAEGGAVTAVPTE